MFWSEKRFPYALASEVGGCETVGGIWHTDRHRGKRSKFGDRPAQRVTSLAHAAMFDAPLIRGTALTLVTATCAC